LLYDDAVAKTHDAAAEVRIQNSEVRIIKRLHTAIDAEKSLYGLFALASMMPVNPSLHLNVIKC